MSLESVKILAEVETTFGISITDAEKIETIRDFSECVAQLTGKELEEVEFTIMTILHESFGIEWKHLKPSAKIVDDLGID